MKSKSNESLKKRAEKHREMQFTRHEMPINIKIENDLLLWEIEVISVRRSISHEWRRRWKGCGLIIARKSDIHYDLYRCHVEAAAHRKKERNNTKRFETSLFGLQKRKCASVAQKYRA